VALTAISRRTHKEQKSDETVALTRPQAGGIAEFQAGVAKSTRPLRIPLLESEEQVRWAMSYYKYPATPMRALFIVNDQTPISN